MFELGDAAVRPGALDVGPVVIMVWAPWCSSCRALGPIIDEVAAASTVRVLAVQVDTDTRLVEQLGVRSIPTLIARRDGVEVARVVGLQTRDVVESVFVSASEETQRIRAHLPRALIALRATAGTVVLAAGMLSGSAILGLIGALVAGWAVVGIVRNRMNQ